MLVAANIREDPTLPGSTDNPQVASAEALREDAAVFLPRKHCAFIGCTDTFSSDAGLIEHLEKMLNTNSY